MTFETLLPMNKTMKSKPISKLFLAVVIFCVVSLVFQATIIVSADDTAATATKTCIVDDETGACKSQSWFDEMGDKTKQFLEQNVFGQKEMKKATREFLSNVAGGAPQDTAKHPDNPFFNLLDRLTDSGLIEKEETTSPKKGSEGGDMIELLIEKSRMLTQDEQSHVGLEYLGILQEALQEAAKQLQDTFGDVLDDIDASIAVAMLYYMAEEDAKKNPTWKRRQHRFYNKVSKEIVLELHDALYLSQLAYVDSMEEFKTGLRKFEENAWELLYGTTDSTPTMPAHFFLMHKKLAPLHDTAMVSLMPWEGKKDNEIEVALVIRGTKHLSDMLSDALLEPKDYRGGKAHGGILTSGKALAEKYASKLKELLKHSGRDKVRLFIVGHSLGAGAGAIAAMELNEYDFINVEVVGFGCPSLLSEELSEATKEYVTTIVADADIVPRMSGTSAMNLLLKLLEFDWTDYVLDDLRDSLQRARVVLPFGHMIPDTTKLLEWGEDMLKNEVKQKIGNEKHERVPNVLMPPGECIHFFRDGVGYTGSYTPCKFFTEIDLVRTVVDDHLVMPGYHRAFISFMRDLEVDYNFDFVHDIASIPV